jgi:hypothetical protein
LQGLMETSGYVVDGRTSREALREGLVDTYEGKALWNIRVTQRKLLEITRKASSQQTSKVDRTPSKRKAGDIRWGDLEAIGSYFGVSKIVAGKWLDEMGLRAVPALQLNQSGDHDMLDMANRSKEKFVAKVPTPAALKHGVASMEHIERGKMEFDVYKWNVDAVKDLLVKAGHPLDTEHKSLLRGRGKNGNVQLKTADDLPLKLYRRWRDLQAVDATRQSSWNIFRGQPKSVTDKVEQLMGKTGVIQFELKRNS